MNKIYHLFPGVISILFIVNACQTYPEADYYETDGVVSIHAEQAHPQNNWEKSAYFTSDVIASGADSAGAAGTLSFSFYIQQPGEYALWVLSTRYSHEAQNNVLPFQLENEEGFLIEASQVQLNSSGALRWLNENPDNEPVMLQFEQPGHYTLKFGSGGQPGYVISRVHLTFNNQRKPEGMGLPETSLPDVDPVLAKRDQPIALPPAWVFGVVYGGAANEQEAADQINRLRHQEFPVDGYWVDYPLQDSHQNSQIPGEIQQGDSYAGSAIESIISNTENTETAQQELKPLIESGVHFFKTEGSPRIELMRAIFDGIEQFAEPGSKRGLLLTGLKGLNTPDFKQYPAKRNSTHFSWTHPIEPASGSSAFGGLKENIEMGANPRLSTYEIPFLIHDLGGLSESAEIDQKEELYIRWTQFAAFTAIMHVFTSRDFVPGLPYQFGETAVRQFKKLTRLRNRLFPYIYSQGHRLRATGQKPVTGDGIHTTQYMFGDAFLVAPIFEPGARERQVYFPDGTWYDYWNDRAYDGGQSWFVEAELTKIPVFIKAGSIIPYRDYSRTVSEGSNQRLMVEIYTGGAGTFRLYEDDGTSTDYQRGKFATTAFRYFEQADYATLTIGAVVGSFEGQVSDKELMLHFKHTEVPARLEADGEVLKQGTGTGEWVYDEAEREIILNWVQPDHQKTEFTIWW